MCEEYFWGGGEVSDLTVQWGLEAGFLQDFFFRASELDSGLGTSM